MSLKVIIDFIGVVAWPVVVLVGLFLFRKPLSTFMTKLGDRVTRLSILQFAIELTPAKEGFAIPDKYGSLTSSHFTSDPEELPKLLSGDGDYDYAVFDLGEGRSWLTSRLFIFATMLQRMSGLRCCVFVDSSGTVSKRFLGTAEPAAVRWALACRYPWLEPAFADVYADKVVPRRGPADAGKRRCISVDWSRRSVVRSARGTLSAGC